MREHPLPSHIQDQPYMAGRPSAPISPAMIMKPTSPSSPSPFASVTGSPETSRLLPNFEPMSHSMMMPLLSLPAIMENPSRLLSGVALAPLWDSSEQGMVARNAVLGGMNPRSRDEVVHQNLLSFVMARKLADTVGHSTTGIDVKNGVFDWFDHRQEGEKQVGVFQG